MTPSTVAVVFHPTLKAYAAQILLCQQGFHHHDDINMVVCQIMLLPFIFTQVIQFCRVSVSARTSAVSVSSGVAFAGRRAATAKASPAGPPPLGIASSLFTVGRRQGPYGGEFSLSCPSPRGRRLLHRFRASSRSRGIGRRDPRTLRSDSAARRRGEALGSSIPRNPCSIALGPRRFVPQSLWSRPHLVAPVRCGGGIGSVHATPHSPETRGARFRRSEPCGRSCTLPLAEGKCVLSYPSLRGRRDNRHYRRSFLLSGSCQRSRL